MPESLAELKVVVSADKEKSYKEILKVLKGVQADFKNNDNALKISAKVSKDSLQEILSQLDKLDLTKDVTLTARKKEFQEIIENALKGIDTEIPVVTNTEIAKKDIEEIESTISKAQEKLNSMQKNQLKSASEYKQIMTDIVKKSANASEKQWNKNAVDFLKAYSGFEAAGGKFTKADSGLKEFKEDAESVKEVVKTFQKNPLVFSNDEDLKKQASEIEKLTQELEQLRNAKKSVNEIPSVEVINTSSNNVSQATTADTSVENKTTIPIEVEPNISDPLKFAEQVSKQITTPITVNVEGTVENPEQFKAEIQKLVSPIDVDVDFKEISNENIDNIKNKVKNQFDEIQKSFADEQTVNSYTPDTLKQLADLIKTEGANAESAASKKKAFADANEKIGKISEIAEPSILKATTAIQNEGSEASNASKKLEDFINQNTQLKKTLNDVSAAADKASESFKKELQNKQANENNSSNVEAKNIYAAYKNAQRIISEIYTLEKENLQLNDYNLKDSEKRIQNEAKLISLRVELNNAEEKLKKVSPEKYNDYSKIKSSFDDQLKNDEKLKTVSDHIKEATTHNEKLASSYEFLNKNVKKYIDLIRKENAGKLTNDESEYLDKIRKIWEDINSNVTKYSVNKDGSLKSIEKAEKAIEKFKIEPQSTITKNIQSSIKQYQNKLSKVIVTGDEAVSKVTELNSAFSQLSNSDFNTEDSILEFVKLESKAQEFFDNYTKGAKEVSSENISNNIADYLEKNTKLSIKFRKELEDLREELEKGVSADKLRDIQTRFLQIQQEAKKAGKEGANVFDVISQRMNEMDVKFIANLLSWQDIIRYIRTVAEEVKNLDTALTEMRKVSEESLESLTKYQSLSFDIAGQIGTTGLQLQQSTADFMRLGESLDDAAESAKVANILMNVSEFESISDATDSLIAMSAAYEDISKLDIVNKLNEIGNNYSISTDGIAAALQRSASALTTAYNDIDESIALITAGNAVVQDPEKVGNGMRTIALRLTGTEEAAEQLAELGEETENIITTQAKLRDVILDATKAAGNGKGFDILDENGNYKSTYEILLGIAELYDKIVETDKKFGTNNLNLLLETIAGKNRANIAASILQNPDTLKKVYNDSLNNYADSATNELSKYLESVEGHIEQFQNAVQDLFYSLMDTGLMNDVIDFGTKFIKILDTIVEHLGSIGSLITAGTIVGLLKNAGKISEAIIDIASGSKTLLEVLKGTFPIITAIISSLTPTKAIVIAIVGAIIAATVALSEFLDKEKQNEKALEKSREEYEEITKTLESMNSELESIDKQIDSINSKEKLSFVDQAELEKLRKQRELLQEEIELEERKQYLAEKNTRENAIKVASDKFFGDSKTYDYYKDELENNNFTEPLNDSSDSINATLALFEYYQRKRNEIEGKYLHSSGKEQKLLKAELDDYQAYLDDFTQSSDDFVTDILQLQKDILGSSSYDDLNNEYKNAYDRLQNIKMFIYQITEPSQYKTLKFDEIFDVEGIEKTREELNEMESNGELDSSVINSYSNLSKAISDAGFTVDEFIEQLKATNDSLTENQQTVESTAFKYNDLSTAIQNANTRILPQFEALKTAYDSIFNGDESEFDLSNIDTSTLETVRAAFEDLDDELNIDWDTKTADVESFLSVIGNSSSTADEVHQAFNELATSYFNAAVTAEDFSEENAAVIEQMLKEMGIVNASEVVDYYSRLASVKNAVTEAGYELSSITAEEIGLLAQHAKMSETDAQMLALLAMQEQLANSNEVMTSNSVAELVRLAGAAGMASEAIKELQAIEASYTQAEKIEANSTTEQSKKLAEIIRENANRRLDKFKEKVQDAYNNVVSGIDLTIDIPKSSSSSSGSSSSSDTEEEEKTLEDLFNEEKELLDDQYEAGLISTEKYLELYRELIEKYFKDVEGYEVQYAKYMKDYYDQLLDYMESAASGVTKLLDKRLDALNDAKDAALDALEAEKDAAADNYQSQIDYIDELIEAKEAEIDAIDDSIDGIDDQIDAINDQIDALQTANEKRQQSINLQKAEYELQKAQNQRVKLQYVNGQMVYTTDTESIRDAKESLDDAKFEIQVQALEDQVTALEKQKELLEDQKELLESQKEALQDQQDNIQKMLDASNDYYDNLISQAESYWDSLIEQLEAQKSKWEEISDMKDIADAYGTVQDVVDDLGYSVEDVLNDVPGAFEAFSNAYKDALSSANANSESFLNGLDYAVDNASTGIENLTNLIPPLADALGNNTDGIVGALNSIKDTSDTDIGTSSESEEGTVVGDFNALKEATNNVSSALGIPDENGEVKSDSLVAALQQLADVGAQTISGDEGLKAQFEALNEAIQTCIAAATELATSISTIPSLPLPETTGNGYASGKHKITKDEIALVGEGNGPELVVDSNNGTYHITNGPELTKLSPGDAVYNARETEKILNSKSTNGGRAFANGTSIMPISDNENGLFNMMSLALNAIKSDVSHMLEPIQTMGRAVTNNNNVVNNSPTINITGTQFTVNGDNADIAVRQIRDEFSGMIARAYQEATT